MIRIQLKNWTSNIVGLVTILASVALYVVTLFSNAQGIQADVSYAISIASGYLILMAPLIVVSAAMIGQSAQAAVHGFEATLAQRFGAIYRAVLHYGLCVLAMHTVFLGINISLALAQGAIRFFDPMFVVHQYLELISLLMFGLLFATVTRSVIASAALFFLLLSVALFAQSSGLSQYLSPGNGAMEGLRLQFSLALLWIQLAGLLVCVFFLVGQLRPRGKRGVWVIAGSLCAAGFVVLLVLNPAMTEFRKNDLQCASGALRVCYPSVLQGRSSSLVGATSNVAGKLPAKILEQLPKEWTFGTAADVEHRSAVLIERSTSYRTSDGLETDVVRGLANAGQCHKTDDANSQAAYVLTTWWLGQKTLDDGLGFESSPSVAAFAKLDASAQEAFVATTLQHLWACQDVQLPSELSGT